MRIHAVRNLSVMLAALFVSIGSVARAETVTWNTTTGQVSGALGAGTGSLRASIEPVTGLCTWTFDGDLHLAPGTVVRLEGSNRAAIVADNIYFGDAGNGQGVTIDVSATAWAPGAGGGVGGGVAAAGQGRWQTSGGHGGAGGAGGNVLINLGAGFGGFGGGQGRPGLSGQAGEAGGAGSDGLGGLSDAVAGGGAGGAAGQRGYNYSLDDGGRLEYFGAPGSPHGGIGGEAWVSGGHGRDADHPGQPGGAGGDGLDGNGGRFAPGGELDLVAGGGGGAGGSGGSGGQGSGGGGGAGGGGGGYGMILLIPVDGNPGGDGGRGGHGGRGGDGGLAGAGGHGAGAVSFTARGLMEAFAPMQVLARGGNGSAGASGQAGATGEAGQPGLPGGTEILRGWGGKGGAGTRGGNGGYGGHGGQGGGGAGGTVRLIGTVTAGLDLTVDCSGGAGGAGGQHGRLVLASDGGSVDTQMLGGSLVGCGADAFGLHGDAVHLADGFRAPRLIGLAEGVETSGIMRDTAEQLGLTAASNCPVVARLTSAPGGYEYHDYDVLLIAAGQEGMAEPMCGIGGWMSTLLTGTGPTRNRLREMSAGEVYGFLVPADAQTPLLLSYHIGTSLLSVYMDPGSQGVTDLSGCPYTEIRVADRYDCGQGPRQTSWLTIAANGELYIRVSGEPESLTPLLASQAVLDPASKLVLDFAGFRPAGGDTYTFLQASTWQGQFGSVEVLGFDPDLVRTDLSGGTFTIVPEPTVCVLLAIGSAALIRRRRT